MKGVTLQTRCQYTVDVRCSIAGVRRMSATRRQTPSTLVFIFRSHDHASCCRFRGLQLHLLSALGEIWREPTVHEEQSVGADSVNISMLMSAQGSEATVADAEARRIFEEKGGETCLVFTYPLLPWNQRK